MRPSLFVSALGAVLLCGACQPQAFAEPSQAAAEAAKEGAPSLAAPAAAALEAEPEAPASAPLDGLNVNLGAAPAGEVQAIATPAAASDLSFEDSLAEAAQAAASAGAKAGESRRLELSAAPQDGARLTAALLGRLGAAGASNALLSPESARTALGMTAEGAPEGAAGDLAGLLSAGAGPQSPAVRSANALWLDARAQLAPGFFERLASVWGAEGKTVDFQDGAAAGEINAWAKAKTEGGVERLLEQPPPASTELILTNALLFKANWATAFDPEQTSPQQFQTASGESVAVPMMISEPTAIFGSNEGVAAVELKFAAPGLSLLLALPAAGSGAEAHLAALERFARTESRQSGMALRQAKAILPKLSLEGGAELKEALAAVGFGPLLDAPLARATAAAPQVSAVTQKVRVEWDEQGATAAAATAVTATRSLQLGEEQPLRFDRPFYFLILQEGAPAPLFAGYVADPRSGAAQ